jgi:DNA-binding GntR family transcriptional regulator
MTDNLESPLARNSLRQQVYDRVRAAILSGEIEPGQRLTETALAQQLGTSRAPIREALRALEQERLIVPVGVRGYTTHPMTTSDVRDLSLLRIALERLAVSLMLERSPEHGFDELEEIVERMARADRRDHDALDLEFHERLCRLAQHSRLVEVWTSIRDQLQLAMRTINESWGSSSGFVDSHRRLLRELRSGDTERAERAIDAHIRSGMERVAPSDGPG